MTKYPYLPPGGLLSQNYIPLLGQHCETPTLTGAKPYPYRNKIWAKSIPLLAQVHKKATLCETTVQK